MKLENKLFLSAFVLFIALVVIQVVDLDETPNNQPNNNFNIFSVNEIPRFKSGDQLIDAFEEARDRGNGGFISNIVGAFKGTQMVQEAAMADSLSNTVEYSDTNIQVEGVDEADIIKTDGKYIYTLSNNNLIIVKAYPEDSARIISSTNLDNFHPRELFIDDDKLLIFGNSNFQTYPEPHGVIADERRPYHHSGGTSVRLYDVSDKDDPELLRTVELEGNYLTSRKIGEYVYFVVNSYPRHWNTKPDCQDIIPLYRETDGDAKPTAAMEPIARCVDIGYIEPIQAANFITIASISMDNEDEEVTKEIVVGSGQNVYASLENLYIAQTTWPRYDSLGEIIQDVTEKTIITKFNLDNGDIDYVETGEVKGHILNQFSMDEHNSYFRIATTSGRIWGGDSTNNVYVLDSDLDVVGELEDLAPGEKIYSVRFMGKKGYVVTFKKVDPLFVIDLSDPDDPEVLGKLKIPGYSDYLHPYDENHIIGIGKDTVEAESDLVERRQMDFAWYQGIKMAIFDVSDVENPKEMHKVIIGDRGTESEALHNHKAFLFDRERNLMVLPITLAEIQGEKSRDNQHGEYTFQGAYVYDVTLDDGFDLRGRVSHYDNDDVYKKSGYYFRGDASIRRSLYIEDVLYTLSNKRLQLNDLDDLDRIKALDFSEVI
ncbi:beta-propeller domain-containing protein [Nanoarchaeota archaeon]